MIVSYFHLLTLEAFLTSTSAWATINHDQVVPIAQGVRDPRVLKYKPYYSVMYPSVDCHPYPAVDKDGRVSGGLKPSGPGNGNCQNSLGQVYARSTTYKGRFAVMYAFYLPKDQKLPYVNFLSKRKQRHEWLHAVFWYDHPDQVEPTAIILYQGGQYLSSSLWSATGARTWLGKGGYQSIQVDNIKQGDDMPLVDWDAMPLAAKNALSQTWFGDWDSQKVPFIEAQFMNRISLAYQKAPPCRGAFCKVFGHIPR